MAYILGLFILLGLVFYSFGQFGLSGNILANISNSIQDAVALAKEKVYDTIFPKTEKEILIDNVESDYTYLDKFFSDTAPKLLKSKDVSDQDKEIIKQAAQKFNETKKSIQAIKGLEQNDKGIIKTIVDKLIKEKIVPQADPTSIPPQCQLVC